MRRLEQHPQNWVHAFGLFLMHPEEGRIKVLQVLLLDLAQTQWQVVQSGRPSARIVVHHVDAVEQVCLKLLYVRALGQAARNAGDDNVLVDVARRLDEVVSAQVHGDTTASAAAVITVLLGHHHILETSGHLCAIVLCGGGQMVGLFWYLLLLLFLMVSRLLFLFLLQVLLLLLATSPFSPLARSRSARLYVVARNGLVDRIHASPQQRNRGLIYRRRRRPNSSYSRATTGTVLRRVEEIAVIVRIRYQVHTYCVFNVIKKAYKLCRFAKPSTIEYKCKLSKTNQEHAVLIFLLDGYTSVAPVIGFIQKL